MKNLLEDYYSQLLQLSRDRAREEIMPYSAGPTSWGKTIAQHFLPGRGRPLSDDERRVLLTLAQELIDLSRVDRNTMVRAINAIVQHLIARGMQLPGFRDEIAPLREAENQLSKKTNNGSLGAIIKGRRERMSTRTERKNRIRNLVKEMQAPMSLSGFRAAAREDEEMPTSLGSPMVAGRPVGERIARLPAALREPVTEMIMNILDLLAKTTEEKGIGGAEAIARGVTQGLKSRGMLLGQMGMSEGTTPVVPKDEHKEKVEKHLSDIKKTVPKMRKEDEERVRGELHTLMQQSDKKFKTESRVSESAIRREIRRVLLEQDPLAKDPKDAKGGEEITSKAMGHLKMLAKEMGLEGSLTPEKVAPIADDIEALLGAAVKGTSASKRMGTAMDKSSQLQSVEKQLKLR